MVYLNNKPIFLVCYLKDKCKTFTLQKQLRNKDIDGLGEKETFFVIHKFLTTKYHLGTDKKDNQLRLENGGYKFDETIIGQMRD